ncbi:MAG: HslU--HslV peptidase proteolytic subunit, partial [Synergistales bacterium]|nr:HslU--HslV peptidase proteolytic subunit [Synergistales bacterium]
DWRTDKVLRRLEAMMLVADSRSTLLLTGAGDILEPEGEACSIGSGAGYALAAARALLESSDARADEIARRSLVIASRICIYTNDSITLEVLED